jgi:hypothetical protein
LESEKHQLALQFSTGWLSRIPARTCLRALHSLQLRIPTTQKCLRLIVFTPVDQDFRMASQHDPTKLSPILIIAIDNNGNRRILSNVLHLGFSSIVT